VSVKGWKKKGRTNNCVWIKKRKKGGNLPTEGRGRVAKTRKGTQEKKVVSWRLNTKLKAKQGEQKKNQEGEGTEAETRSKYLEKRGREFFTRKKAWQTDKRRRGDRRIKKKKKLGNNIMPGRHV